MGFDPSYPPSSSQKAWLKVDEPFKGTTEGAIFVTAEEGTCSIIFPENDGKWLIYAHPLPNSDTVFLGCGRSRKLQYAGDDMLFLHSPSGLFPEEPPVGNGISQECNRPK